MNYWTILGLDGPTDDQKIIKKAYAKKLRVTRPDDDPTGFMTLRKALEQAQYSAQHHVLGGHSEDRVETTIQSSSGLRNSDQNNDTPSALSKNVDCSEISDLQQIMRRVEVLLTDTFGRAQSAKWQAIFDDRSLESIDTTIDFEHQFRDYLLDKFGYFSGDNARNNRRRKPPLITSRIGTLIFDRMGWRDIDGRPLYIQDQLSWLRIDLDVINKDRSKNKVKADIDFIDQTIYEHNEEENGFPAWIIGVVLLGFYIIFKWLSGSLGDPGI